MVTVQAGDGPVSAPLWRRTLTGVLSVMLVMALLSAVEFACLARMASSQVVREALSELQVELGALADLGVGDLNGSLGGLGGPEMGGDESAGATPGLGVIRGMRNIPTTVSRGVGSVKAACGSLGLLSVLLVLVAGTGLLAVGGTRAAAEATSIGLLVTGFCCVAALVVLDLIGRKAGLGGGDLPAALIKGLIRDASAFQAAVGLSCLVLGVGGALAIWWVEKPTSSPSA